MSDTTRRSILAALGSTSGALAVGTASGTTTKTIDFKHVCHGAADYMVRVTGQLKKTSNVEGDGLDVIINDGQVAKGGLGPKRGRDTYKYTGEIEDLQVSGPVVVEANGQRLYTPDCAKDDKVQTAQPETTEPDDCSDPCGDMQCPLDNTLKFSGVPKTSGEVVITVEVSANGVIEDQRNGERFKRCEYTTTADHLRRTGITLRYSGELTCLSIEGPARAHIEQKAPCKGGDT